MRGNMEPDETNEDQDITLEEARDQGKADPEWSGVGEKPLKDHVRNEETVDLEEGAPVGVHIGAKVENWAGDYEARPDHVARDPNITPPYDVADPFAREQFRANGPGRDEPTFDVHDYVEREYIAPGTDLSGYITPQYD